MTLPNPARKAVDLFNRVTETNLFDVAANKVLYAELLKLSRRGPDLIVSTALARVALRLGCRDEAMESMERAERLTDYAFVPVVNMLADIHAIAGQSRRAIEIYEALLGMEEGIGDPRLLVNAVKTGMMLGMTGWLRRISDACRELSVPDVAAPFAVWLRQSGLGDIFAEHQATVSQAVGNVRVDMWAGLVHDDFGVPLLVIDHFVPGDRRARAVLEDALFSAERALYAKYGRHVSDFGPYLLNAIDPAPQVDFVPFVVAS